MYSLLEVATCPGEHSTHGRRGMGSVDNDLLCKEGTGILRVGSAFPESLAAWELLEET